jgi:AraC-like DNA-binding protein
MSAHLLERIDMMGSMDQSTNREWSRYYRLDSGSSGALHAQFVAHRYPRHMHDFFVVGLVERGTQSYWYRGASHNTPAGQVFFVNPDEPHTGESAGSEGYLYRTLYLDCPFLIRVMGGMEASTKLPSLKGAVVRDPILTTLLTRFHNCLADEQALGAKQESLLLEVIAHLLSHHADDPLEAGRAGDERSAVTRAREYMESHFDINLSLVDIAAAVSLSPYYFARAFERATGLPPHTYLESVRIRKAREILDGGASIVSTALSVGYADQSHLTRRFKRFLGITPGQYIRDRRIFDE